VTDEDLPLGLDEDRREGHGRRDEDKTIEVKVKEKTLTPTFMLLCASVILSSAGLLGIFAVLDQERSRTAKVTDIAEDTNEIVRDIERRSSPETLEERDALLDAIVLRIDCNQRQAFQDTLDALEERGVLEEGAVEVLDDRCETGAGG